MTAPEAERLARIGWNVVAEPGDPAAVALVDALGAVRSLGWARWAAGTDLDTALRALRAELREQSDRVDEPDRVERPDAAGLVEVREPGPRAAQPGLTPGVAGEPDRASWAVAAEPSPRVMLRVPGTSHADRAARAASHRPGRGSEAGTPSGERHPRTVPMDDPGAGPGMRPGASTSPLTGPAARRVLGRALARWAPRLTDLDPGRTLDRADRLHARLLVPGDADWPRDVDDLGGTAPLCLWVRGDADLSAVTPRSIALVGARAATAYGEHVATDLASGLVEVGCTVVSGGAYGIDVAAHRGALAAGGLTIALLAGGVDRTYPAGNHSLLESLAHEHGAVVAECPPGTAPVRARFLLRNRLIAALSGATVVVEAAWRSGALSTAAHATALLRPLGAVPGPVTSMASAGSHRLIRDGAAVCITGVEDVLELLGPSLSDEHGRGGTGTAPVGGAGPGRPRPDDLEARVLDALPLRGSAEVGSLARAAGLARQETEAALGRLELAGQVARRAGRWSMLRTGAVRET